MPSKECDAEEKNYDFNTLFNDWKNNFSKYKEKLYENIDYRNLFPISELKEFINSPYTYYDKHTDDISDDQFEDFKNRFNYFLETRGLKRDDITDDDVETFKDEYYEHVEANIEDYFGYNIVIRVEIDIGDNDAPNDDPFIDEFVEMTESQMKELRDSNIPFVGYVVSGADLAREISKSCNANYKKYDCTAKYVRDIPIDIPSLKTIIGGLSDDDDIYWEEKVRDKKQVVIPIDQIRVLKNKYGRVD